MKDTKIILRIVLIFMVVCFGLLFLYKEYLEYYNHQLQSCDAYTYGVAKCASELLNFLGYDNQLVPDNSNYRVWIYLEGKYAAYVNEGCNAISVTIVYISFIIAFYQGFKKTFVYLLITLPLFYIINIFRVASLTYVYRFYPEYSKISHDIIFPAIIWGTAVLFWFIWIQCVVLPNSKK